MSDENKPISPFHPRPRAGKTARDKANGHRQYAGNFKTAVGEPGEDRGHLGGHLHPSWVKSMSKQRRSS